MHLQLTMPLPHKSGGGGDTMMGGMEHAATTADGFQHSYALKPNTSRTAKLVFETVVNAGVDSSEGVHINIIAGKANMDLNAVKAAVEELMEVGALYPTLDEYHVAAMSF